MELNQLRYFVLTARLQNMSKAAQRLNLTQPSLSKSISNLESELGVELFDRVGKRLVLNERGIRFLGGAEAALSGLEESINLVTDSSIGSRISIGFFRQFEQVHTCMSEFQKAHPECGFSVHKYENTGAYVDTDAYDMLVYPKEDAFRKYRGRKLMTERFYLALNREYATPDSEYLCLNELSELSFVILRYSERSYETAYKLCISSGIRLKISCFTDNTEAHRELISKGLGAGFVSEGASSAYRNDPEIRLIAVSDEGFSQDIMIGFKRDKHLSEASRNFKNFTTDYFNLY